MSNDEKREELKERIAEGEARHAARAIADGAKEAAGNAAEFVKKNPLVAVGGAIAAGLAIGLMTKPGRRIAGKAVGRSSVFATLARDAVLAYGVKLIDEATSAARTGQDKLEDLSDAARDTARTAKREASYIATKAGDNAASAKRAASRKTRRAVRGFRDRISQ
ncbi:hypothetical protein [Altererythrobacter lutimaris]|uniref:DUF883 family protein n=1 Tax=Altererythrobacter lutimaris TaxID=2743979 RepID=A0A850H9V5_9SPHN|nr:hypothetical protein [Altererythrobacter lutimaris]NVE93731.1 hypothetical protein [Altererythrobacter lutimaris]